MTPCRSSYPAADIVPVPPDFLAGQNVVWFFTILFTGISAAALVWAVRKGLRGGTWIPAFLWLGGLLCAAQEPIQDHLVHLWWAVDAPGRSYQTFGYQPPFWVFGIYTSCLCLTPYAMWRRFQSGVTRRTFIKVWLAFGVVDVAVELPCVNTGAWRYYGDQPFEFFNYPLYNFWANGVGFLAAGVALYVLFPSGVGGPREWRALFAPFAYVAIWMTVPVPVVISLNSPLPEPAAWLVNLLSLGLAWLAVRAMAAVVATDGPPMRLGAVDRPAPVGAGRG